MGTGVRAGETREEQLEIAPHLRVFRMKNAFSGMVRTGMEKIVNGYGNGDCIMAAPGRGLFGIGDATDRFPGASREFLMRVVSMAFAGSAPVTPEAWKTLAEKCLLAQPFHYKTTYGLAALDQAQGKSTLTILSGGDSRVLLVSGNGSIRYESPVNMGFAGRSRELSHMEVLHPAPGDRVVMFTDGFPEVLGKLGGLEYLLSLPVDQAGEWLRQAILTRMNGKHHDDAGFLIVDPLNIHDMASPAVFLGGTSPWRESLFGAGCSQKDFERWIPANRLEPMSGNGDLREYGFRLLGE